MHAMATLEEAAAEERIANRLRAVDWLLPLLPQLLSPAGLILNVGCGVGTDVELLNEKGFCCIGCDPGARAKFWAESPFRGRFVAGDGTQLPFRDSIFQLVLSFDTIEHIGTPAPDYSIYEKEQDYTEKLVAFCKELVRITRPGGGILLTSPNRWSFVDPGHGDKVYGFRLHTPWENTTLLSLPTLQRLFPHLPMTHLPLTGYYRFERSQRVTWKRQLVGLVKWFLAIGDRVPFTALRILGVHHALWIRVPQKEETRRGSDLLSSPAQPTRRLA